LAARSGIQSEDQPTGSDRAVLPDIGEKSIDIGGSRDGIRRILRLDGLVTGHD
jgi:hypothetical protein